jgi:hypothetical protein
VIMRPLYQEVIYQICVTMEAEKLPIGWIKIIFWRGKGYFPMLLVRNRSFSYRKAN